MLAIAEAEGRARVLEERRAALAADTGLMLGRLELKDKVDSFLVDLQEAANRKNVEKLEGLLNHLLQEVFPDEVRSERTQIRLELTAETAGPGLEVQVENDGRKEEREDAYGDNGGALTNVLSMGLRLVSVVRSRTAPFLLLDEADCWIETGRRVESFYDVLKSSAHQLGIQTLAISHHDLARFADDVHVVRIEGFPKRGGVRLRNESGPPVWKEGQRGFRSMRLVNFQGFVDARLDLAPGLTGIAGPNNRGKSSVTRAWRAVFYGEVRGGLIRHGAQMATIEVGLDGGRFVRFSRHRKRTPVNIWSLHEADGAIVDEDGLFHETGGTSVPDWVRRVSGIDRVEGLDLHLSNQKTPVFLLNETATKRASVLSIGREAGYIQAMQKLHKTRCKADKADSKRNEGEIASIDSALRAHGTLRAVAPTLDDALVHAERVTAREQEVEILQGHADRIDDLSRKVEAARLRHDAFSDLPDAERFRALVATATEVGALAARLDRLDGLLADVATAERRSEALATLPGEPPVPRDGDALMARVDRIDTLTLALGRAEARSAALADLPQAPPALVDADGLLGRAQGLATRVATFAQAERRLATLSGLPEALPGVVPSEALVRNGMRLRKAVDGVAALEASVRACADLPMAFPALDRSDAHEARATALERAVEALRRAQAADEAIGVRLVEVRADVEALIEACGGACPACGHAVTDASHVLEGHAA